MLSYVWGQGNNRVFYLAVMPFSKFSNQLCGANETYLLTIVLSSKFMHINFSYLEPFQSGDIII